MPKTSFKEFDQFIDELVNAKGLTNLEPEVLEQLKKDLADRLEDRINAVILEKIPPEKLEEFEKLLDTAADQEMQEYCQQNIPDLDQAIAGALLEFKNTYLGG